MKVTQGRRLIALLKRRSMTTRELLSTGISVCPWKRVAECLHPHEQLVRSADKAGRTLYRVVAATKWTA